MYSFRKGKAETIFCFFLSSPDSVHRKRRFINSGWTPSVQCCLTGDENLNFLSENVEAKPEFLDLLEVRAQFHLMELRWCLIFNK